LRRSLENKNGTPFIIFLNDEHSKNSAEFYVCILKIAFCFLNNALKYLQEIFFTYEKLKTPHKLCGVFNLLSFEAGHG